VLRLAAPAALVLLLSGCFTTPPPAAIEAAEAVPDDDGMTVTATRVEPLVHEVDTHGRIQARTCQVGRLDSTSECNGGGLVAAGIAWEVPVRDFADPEALFWRVSLVAEWQSSSLVEALRMTVFTTTPCGLACVDLRKVAEVEDPAHPGFDRLDVYLEAGETGVRIQLEPIGYTETTWSEAAVYYHLHGTINGYRPVASPVVLQ
jgi:hypothetical protein